MKDIFRLIKSIVIDIMILYKNFVHWNLSKIFIWLASIILSIAISLPFIVILIIMYFWLNLGEYLNWFDTWILDLFSLLWWRPVVFVFFSFISVLLFVGALFWYSYKKVLFTKLNLSYLEWNKLGYLKNSYIDFKLILKYFQVIVLISLFLLVPIIVFFVLFFILFFVFWGSSWVEVMIKSSTFNLFSISILIVAILCFVAFVYISYRLYFAVIMLADKKNYDELNRPIFYLRESFIKTKDFFGFMNFVLVMIILSIFVLPFGTMQDHFWKSLKYVRAYIWYTDLWEIEKSEVDNNQDYYYISDLKELYKWFSSEKLESMEVTYFYLNYFLVIFNFLIISWLFEMTYVSFYKHKIVKDKTIFSKLFS